MNMRLLTRDNLSSPLWAIDFPVSLSESCPMKKRLLKKEVEILKQILAWCYSSVPWPGGKGRATACSCARAPSSLRNSEKMTAQ